MPTAASCRRARAALLLQHSLAARLDATYSAKACAAALALAAAEPGPTLFWLTFDGRWLGGEGGGS